MSDYLQPGDVLMLATDTGWVSVTVASIFYGGVVVKRRGTYAAVLSDEDGECSLLRWP